MTLLLQWSLWIVGISLQFLLVSTMLGGAWKKYVAVFLYSAVLFVTTIIEIIAALDRGQITSIWAEVYWGCEFVRHAALYCVVLASVAQAVGDAEHRQVVRYGLAGLGLALWGASFYVQWDANAHLWMTNAFRNVSFSAAIINLGLWFVLIASRRRDATLLMITGGLGIQMTGEAIGQSLRQMAQSTVMLGGVLAVAAHFACLYIWFRAFRPQARPENPPGLLSPDTPSASPHGPAMLYVTARARAVNC